MEPEELERAVEAILFAAGEPVELKRLSQALGCESGEVQEAVDRLADQLAFQRRGIRVVRLEMGILASKSSQTTSTSFKSCSICRRVLVIWPGYH